MYFTFGTGGFGFAERAVLYPFHGIVQKLIAVGADIPVVYRPAIHSDHQKDSPFFA